MTKRLAATMKQIAISGEIFKMNEKIPFGKSEFEIRFGGESNEYSDILFCNISEDGTVVLNSMNGRIEWAVFKLRPKLFIMTSAKGCTSEERYYCATQI